MRKNSYKFYISRYEDGDFGEYSSIEDTFPGMFYRSCAGLSNKGAIKNIYTESYAETSELRLFLPDTPARENPDIEFEFVFAGEDRRDVYDNFVDYVSGYRLRYYDDCRNRELEMVLIDGVEIDDDVLHGGTPYFIAKFKFRNLSGDTVKHGGA